MQRQEKNRPSRAFTLVEMMVAIAVAVIVVSMVVMSGKVIRTNVQIRTTKATVQVMVNALQEYKGGVKNANNTEVFTYAFPPWDRNSLQFSYSYLLSKLLEMGFILVSPGSTGSHGSYWGGDLKLERAQARIEFLYYCLDDVPASQSILDRLPDSKRVNADGDSVIAGDGTGSKPLMEVIDAWKIPLDYRWQGVGNFPLVISAGPDQQFDTADDILSSELQAR